MNSSTYIHEDTYFRDSLIPRTFMTNISNLHKSHLDLSSWQKIILTQFVNSVCKMCQNLNRKYSICTKLLYFVYFLTYCSWETHLLYTINNLKVRLISLFTVFFGTPCRVGLNLKHLETFHKYHKTFKFIAV